MSWALCTVKILVHPRGGWIKVRGRGPWPLRAPHFFVVFFTLYGRKIFDQFMSPTPPPGKNPVSASDGRKRRESHQTTNKAMIYYETYF